MQALQVENRGKADEKNDFSTMCSQNLHHCVVYQVSSNFQTLSLYQKALPGFERARSRVQLLLTEQHDPQIVLF